MEEVKYEEMYPKAPLQSYANRDDAVPRVEEVVFHNNGDGRLDVPGLRANGFSGELNVDPTHSSLVKASVREPSKVAPLRKTGKKSAKTISTKAEADWLKRCFPAVIEGEAGRWDVRPDCAGFGVYFRVDKRQNDGEPINLKFPRISREMFLTLKGMSENERTNKISNYVGSHLGDAVIKGNDRARVVAGKLRIAS